MGGAGELEAAYLDIELGRTDGRSTRRLLAERFGLSELAVAQRLARARRKGLLPPTAPGARGGRLETVRRVAGVGASVFVVQDCRDHYGPYFVAVAATLEAAQRRAAAEVRGTLRWGGERQGRWESRGGEFQIDREPLHQ